MEQRMKFFFDTEFIERGPKWPVTLISIGIVDERGGTFYAVSADFREEDCSEWVKANVLPHLEGHQRLPLSDIAILIREWVDVQCDGAKPEFWAYYADYDWVVLAQIFGTMMDLPEGWPMYCRDIKQLCDSLGNPELPKQSETEHDALADARWNKVAYEFLRAASTPGAAGRGWIDVKDDSPNTTEDCLVVLRGETHSGYLDTKGRWRVYAWAEDDGIEQDAEVTHWQPLPAPPSGEQSAIAEDGRSSDFNNKEKLQSEVAPGPQEGREDTREKSQ